MKTSQTQSSRSALGRSFALMAKPTREEEHEDILKFVSVGSLRGADARPLEATARKAISFGTYPRDERHSQKSRDFLQSRTRLRGSLAI